MGGNFMNPSIWNRWMYVDSTDIYLEAFQSRCVFILYFILVAFTTSLHLNERHCQSLLLTRGKYLPRLIPSSQKSTDWAYNSEKLGSISYTQGWSMNRGHARHVVNVFSTLQGKPRNHSYGSPGNLMSLLAPFFNPSSLSVNRVPCYIGDARNFMDYVQRSDLQYY